MRHEHELWIDALEDGLRDPQARHHARLTLLDAGTRLRAIRHDRPGGEVARPEVLGERPPDQVVHRTAVACRSMPAAA